MAFQFNNHPSQKTFSDTNNALKFQTESMVQKIKTIHKKKKKRNYKNIELLENIHDVNKDNSNKQEPVVEGLAVLPVATFSEDDWTTADNIYEGGKTTVTSTSHASTGLIDAAYEFINNLTTKSAKIIVNGLSGKKRHETDIPIVKKYICWALSILVASFVIFNWIFLMFYKESGERIPLYDISRDTLHNAGLLNKFYALLDFLFDIPVAFPEKLQSYFVADGPEFIRNYINITVCFVLLFVFLIRFLYTSASSLRIFLTDVFTFNMANPILSFMYGATFLLYILSFFEFRPISTALTVAKLVSGFPASLIVPFISNIFKIFFLMICSVPFASIFCVIYIFVHSFFGIPLFSEQPYLETISKIYKYMASNKIPIKKDTNCNPLPFFERIINSLIIMIDFIYKNIIQLSIIVMLIYGIIDYATNIKGPVLKLILLLFNSMLIIAIGLNSFSNYTIQDPVEEPIPPEPTFNDMLAKDASDLSEWMSSITSRVPDLNEITKKIPEYKNEINNKIQELNKKLPDLNELAKKIPDLNELANKIPNINELANKIPNINNMNTLNPVTNSIAAPLQMPTRSPNISGINQSIPGVNS